MFGGKVFTMRNRTCPQAGYDKGWEILNK